MKPSDIIIVTDDKPPPPVKRTVLVTGGTGSFGRTMVQELLKRNTGGEIRVFSRDEAKQDAMRQELNDPRVTYYLGDIRDYDSIRAAMNGIDFVFHAAALKQVPSCEVWPMEAVKTNVLGADNVMRAAIDAEVQVCVMLSTDKAVYPVSAMGTSKAMMEKLMLARSQRANKTVLCATRYGNVMDSRGSVIPLFVKQIKSGVPMTITDPRMTRFLMSLQESVDLVLYAFRHATPGDIFVKRARACRITELASALRRMVHPRPDEPVIIGGRPGEKLHESLVSTEERSRAIQFEEYYQIPIDVGNRPHNAAVKDYSSNTVAELSRWELADILKTLPCVQGVMS